jgi:hypothetical protein
MRIRQLLAAATLVAAPLAAAPALPSASVVRTDDGYLMGRPTAPLKLVVLSAYGCPHCRALDEAMMRPLRRDWIDTGKVSLRYVPYGMFPTDVPAIFLSECGSPGGFFDRSSRIFRMQGDTTTRYRAASDPAKKALADGPPENVPKGLAALSGLDAASADAGVPRQDYARCLASPALRHAVSQRQKLISARYHFPGTPAVWLNGQPTGTGSSWPKLEAALKAASH